MFLSALLRGKRVNRATRTPSSFCFNPRSRAESERRTWIPPRPLQGFNPRSRAESERRTVPSRRDTPGFNPRSRAESEPGRAGQSRCIGCFNPRSRAESERTDVKTEIQVDVSIRAPARRASASTSHGSGPRRSFNPRSRAESEPQGGYRDTDDRAFQSALPRGERGAPPFAVASLSWFQSALPRGERGSDGKALILNGQTEVFRELDVPHPIRGHIFKFEFQRTLPFRDFWRPRTSSVTRERLGFA